MRRTACLLLLLSRPVTLFAFEEDAPLYGGASPVRFSLGGRMSVSSIWADRLASASAGRNTDAPESREERSLDALVLVQARKQEADEGDFIYNLNAAAEAGEKTSISRGSTLFLGLSLCPDAACVLGLGRVRADARSEAPAPFADPTASSHAEFLTGSEGGRTGAGVFLRGEHAGLELLPFLVPSANSPPSEKHPQEKGGRAQAFLLFANAGLTVHYEQLSQKSAAGKFPGTDRLEFTGAGLYVARPEGFLQFYLRAGIERVSGRYSTMHAGESASTRADIDGQAIRSGVMAGIGPVRLVGDFFLPEPPSTADGSRRRNEKSGYIGMIPFFDDSLIARFDRNPFPLLCGSECGGIDARKETVFRSAAAVARLRLGLQTTRLQVFLGGEIFRALAPRTDESSNPFLRIRPDPEQPEFREASIRISWTAGRGTLHARYQRLYGKVDRRMRLIGQSGEIMIARELF